MLGLNGVLVGALALLLTIAIRGGTVSAQLAYFSCQPEENALVYFYGGSQHMGATCCQVTIELLPRYVLRVSKIFSA